MSELSPERKAYNLAIRAPDAEAVSRLIREFHLDYGCRPTPELLGDGSYRVPVFAAPQAALDRLREKGYAVEVLAEVDPLAPPPEGLVGQGDRFQGGELPPHGLGEKAHSDRDEKGRGA